jgi:Tfp pilus assembly protein PilX
MPARRMLQSRREAGSVLIIALLLMILLSLLGVTLLTVATSEHSIAANSEWSEGALMAAEAGLNRGLNQLSANAQTSLAQINLTDIGSGYKYRSGPRTGSAAPLEFMGTRTEPGYSIAVGTGYNPSGYAFHTYRVRSTGTGGPIQMATREVEVQAEYGPVSQ